MIDLTRSLYLGFDHPASELTGWTTLTNGAPAALEPLVGSGAAGAAVAGLVEREAALLAPSTLHLFADLIDVLTPPHRAVVALEAGSYPITRWAVRHVAAAGTPGVVFRHHDPASLWRILDAPRLRHRVPVIICDGLCVNCGRVAPLRAYARVAGRRGGWLVVDDTQAVGLLGHPTLGAGVYGHGGGGSAARSGIDDPRVIVVASMAKAMGVPAAFLAGSAPVVELYRRQSRVRLHTSQVSAADLSALRHALVLHHKEGSQRRHRLEQLVRAFRAPLRGSGTVLTDSLFPVQQLWLPPACDAAAIHRQLLASGVRTLLIGSKAQPRLGGVVTARHARAAVVFAARSIAVVLHQAARLGGRTDRHGPIVGTNHATQTCDLPRPRRAK